MYLYLDSAHREHCMPKIIMERVHKTTKTVYSKDAILHLLPMCTLIINFSNCNETTMFPQRIY